MEKMNTSAQSDASLVRVATFAEQVAICGEYHFECFSDSGKLKWEADIKNLVTTVGKNDMLDKYLGLSAASGWYMGLISSSTYSTGPAAGDTMSSHSGWLEAGSANAPTYSQSTRPAPTFAAASSGSKATSANVVFSITSSGTVKGSFLVSNSTKDGSTGILFSAGTFTGGDKAVSSGDTLNGTYTLSL